MSFLDTVPTEPRIWNDEDRQLLQSWKDEQMDLLWTEMTAISAADAPAFAAMAFGRDKSDRLVER